MAFNFKKLWGRPQKVGLVLSGGGLRGIGHLGAIKALEEHGYKPSIISGCSIGAIVGAFYAAGYTVEEMLSVVKENNLFPTMSLRLRTSGFVDNHFVSRLIQKYIPQNTFESLKIPLHVSATNFLSGQTERFQTGKLDEALLASSSIPVMFPSVKRNGSIYYDGGILDNLPVTPLLGQCKTLIGVHVNAPDQIMPDKLTPAKILDRITHLAIGQSVADSARKCDLFLEPPEMLKFSMFGKKELMDIYEYVYTYSSRFLDQQ
ncbi:patatin-like phospholipase family protein [Parapedobacter sp. 10938]|uniref:patatin-like phospholipase family protein n=1 Tax=Parapedobacter flavus TaxID=3110225 RepID=UPI002DB93BD6|nr:patatin-like phospholipase family protein [Parapedobacter sp. 10938]MEC3881354.1 patatin-like phospholipase family protein [Parapedobacter sp. 10938]